jgi:hypothetical protein
VQPKLRQELLLQLERDKQTDYRCEQSHGLDKSRDDQHGSLDTTSSLRLTGDTFHGTTTDATDTHTSADSGKTSTNTSTHYGKTCAALLGNLKQNLKQHNCVRLDILSKKQKITKEIRRVP